MYLQLLINNVYISLLINLTKLDGTIINGRRMSLLDGQVSDLRKRRQGGSRGFCCRPLRGAVHVQSLRCGPLITLLQSLIISLFLIFICYMNTI